MLSIAVWVCIHPSHLAQSVAETALLLACGVHLLGTLCPSLCHCRVPICSSLALLFLWIAPKW